MNKDLRSLIDLDYLKDPKIFDVNLLSSHASLKQRNLSIDQGEEISLDGIWEHSRFPKMDPELAQIILGDGPELGKIEVPLSAEVKDKEHMQYSNMPYAWDGKKNYRNGDLDVDVSPVNVYRRKFTLSKEQLTDKIVLSLKGFESASYIYLNGKFVAYSERLYVPSEVDIAPYAVEGKNTLIIFNFVYSTSSWLLDQDFWTTSGLFRSVTLQSFGKKHLKDIKIIANLDDSYQKGLLSMEADIDDEASLSFFLKDKDVIIAQGDFEDGLYQGEPLSIYPWSAESPYLYDLLFLLKDERGKIVEESRTRIGFSRSEIKDGLILFNGKRLLLRGVNRHEWSMHKGRAITKEETLFDLKLLKEHNFNAIRTCHYPDDEYLYELADELGFYVIDEACIETHGTWGGPTNKMDDILPHNRKEWFDICIDRGKSMVLRDRNHPSIFMWSLGNESFGGQAFREMRKAIEKLDDRPIHYESVVHEEEFADVTDVRSEMYTIAVDIRQYLKTHHDKPFILCEYAHAMGNSNGDMEKYMALFDEFPQFQGGFIWDYIDQGILDIQDEERRINYGGDYDDRPNSGNFNCNGLLWSDRDDTARNGKLQAIKTLYSPIQIAFDKSDIKIRNLNLFLDSSSYHYEVSYLDDGHLIQKESFEEIVAPTSVIIRPLPKLTARVKGELTTVVRVLDGKENLVALFSSDTPFSYKGESPKEKGEITIGAMNLGYICKDFSALWSFEQNQGLASINIGGKETLKCPIRPTFWRPSTDNDRGNHFVLDSSDCYGWSKFAYFNPLEEGLRIEPDLEGRLNIQTRYNLEGKGKKPYCHIDYRIGEGGYIEVTIKYEAAPMPFTLPCFGVVLTLPKEFEKFSYYGRGPLENYTDRKAGSSLGIYEGESSKEFLPYSIPQECGNHLETRWIKVTDGKTTMKIEAVSAPFAFKLLPYDEFQIEEAQHDYELPKRRFNYLTILAATRGVGGDDSWGRPVHEEFEIPSDKDISLTFRIYPEK